MELPGYHVNDVIGKGGMATVYRAEHILLKQVRALKVMSPELSSQDGFKESFLREGQIVAALKHPNIVTIYDIGEHQGHYYMAMEYLLGGSLEEKLSEGSLPLATSIKILKEIGSALDLAHQNKLVHRDIKPANILFNTDGDAFLTDFGISKIQDTDSHLTQMGYGMIGTPRYMSPEQTGGETVDARSDQYSFGLLFFEMLTGSKAIKSNGTAAIIKEHALTPPPKLPDQYRFLQDVLDKTLEKQAVKRYSNMGAFLSAVELAQRSNDETVILPPPRSSNKPKKKSNLTTVLLSSVLLLIVVAAGGFWWFGYKSQNTFFLLNTEEIEIAKPEVAKPEVVKPEVAKPEVAKPEVAKPEVAKPEVAKPEVAKPEVVKPEVVKPEVVKPEVVKPEVAAIAVAPVSPSSRVVRVAPYTVLYQEPGNKRLQRINQGEKVLVTGVIKVNGKEWSRVVFSGQTGYVKKKHLK